MHIGAGIGVEANSDVVENIPEGFGLAIDANTSDEYDDALRIAKTASEYECDWFEEPLSHTDIGSLAELNSAVSVPISG